MKLVNTWVNGLTLFVLFFFFSIFSHNIYAAPIAKITGPDVVLTGGVVSLNGAQSNGKNLNFHWRIVKFPIGSQVQISNPKSSHIAFQANRSGEYEVELQVAEGKNWSAPKRLSINSVLSSGEEVLSTEEYSASFICKISFGLAGCNEVVRQFNVDKEGVHTIVIDNHGTSNALITLNGVNLNSELQFVGSDEVAAKKVYLKKQNQLRVQFKKQGYLGGVQGSFNIKILREGKIVKSSSVAEENSTTEETTEQNLPPAPTAQDIKTIQNIQGVTRIFPNDPNTTQKMTYSIVTAPASGTAVINAQGYLYYLPNNNFIGQDQVTVKVKDNGSPSLSTNITVGVTVEQNYAPNPTAADILAIQGGTGQTQVFPNDPNTVPQNFRYELISAPANGVISQYGSHFVYQPNTGYSGTDIFTVKVSDDGNPSLSGTKTINVTVIPNTIPVVSANDITTFQSKMATTQVSFVDSDAGQGHIYFIANAPAHGTASINTQGVLYYLPTVGYFGSDSVTVAVRDTATPAGIGTKTIAITVQENRIPVVSARDFSTPPGYPATTQVSYTDEDTNQYHTFYVSQRPSHGKALLTQQGALTYTPDANYSGVDTMVVAVSDSAVPPGIGTKTINISVVPNTIPTVIANDINIFQGANGSTQLSYNDPDLGQNHVISIQTNPQFGFLFVDPLNVAVYTPTDRCTAKQDSFVVKVTDDGIPPATGTKTVHINVTPNTKPVVAVDDFSIEQNQTMSKQVQVTDPDAGDSVTYAIKQQPQYGTVAITSTGLLTYTHMTAVAATEDSFQISVKDQFGDCTGGEVLKTVQVHIQANRAPVLAVNDLLIEQDTIGHLTATATDADHYQTLTYAITQNPTHGTVELAANGAITYTPNANYSGTDSFKVTARDNGLPMMSDEKTVHVTIEPTNNPPVPTAPGIALLSGNSATTTISPGDPDVSQTHTYQIISTPSLGTATVNELGVVTFNANPGVEGVEEIQVRVTDSGVFPKSAIAYVAVEVVRNLAPNPSAVNIATMVAGMSATFTVAPNDPNEARFPGQYTFAISSLPNVGTAQVTTGGVVTYTAPVGYVGNVEFDVSVTDNGSPALTGTAHVQINVVANSAPVVSAQNFTTPENTGADKQIVFTDANSTLQTFTFAITQAPAHGTATVDAQGLVHYQPAQNYLGTDSFQVQVTDNGNPPLSGVATYSVNVQDTNNIPPTFASFEYYMRETTLPVWTEFNFIGLTDPDGTVDEVRVDFGDGTETLVLNKNDLGPNSGHQVLNRFEHYYKTSGTFTVNATIVDNHGAITTAQKIVTIGNNTLPVARITFNSMQGSVPLTISADGTASTDSDGTITRYSYKVTNNDTGEIVYNSGFITGLPNFNYTLTNTGVYKINVCVYDNGNAYSCQNQLAYAGVDRPDSSSRLATASFTTTPKTGTAPLTITLNGTSSRGAQGAAIASYQWAINGLVSETYGKEFKKYLSGGNITTTLPAAGVYDITLSVLDVNGNSGSINRKILVDGASNSTPELIAVNYGNRSFGFRLETHGASIPADSIYWDLGNNQTASGTQAFVTYSSNDAYTVKAQAYDTNGHKYVLTKVIDLNQNLTAPQIFIVGGQQNTYQLNEAITFNASATTDVNGPLTFTWNFGDGTPTISGVGNDFASVSHAYSDKGYKHWELRVTNAQGLSSVFGFDTNIIVGTLPALATNLYPQLGVAPHLVRAIVTSSTPNILGYTWNFGQFAGGQIISGDRPSNIYYKPGSYPVSVTALDTNGNIVTANVATVNVSDYNKRPVVLSKTLTVPKNGKLTYTIEYTDADPVTQTHSFAITQQPTHGTATLDSTGEIVYIPATDFIGTDIINVKVSDSSTIAGVGNATLTINVTGDTNQPPVIGNLNYDYSNDSFPRQVHIEADQLSDSDGEISKVVWDFGDGSAPFTIVKSMIESPEDFMSMDHFYTQAGTYTATYTVYDNEGDSSSKTVSVVLGTNVPPIPSYTVQAVGTVAPYTLNVNASASTDTDGTIEIYCWGVEKEGSEVYSQCDNTASRSITLNESGLYTINFYIRDNQHASVSKSFDLMVDGTDHSQDVDPYAIMRATTPRMGNAPLTVSWSGQNSRAMNGKTVTSKLWSLSDRQFVGKNNSGNTVSFTYTTPGTHYATLGVTDSAGRRSVINTPVYVGPAPTLKAGFAATTNNGMDFNFDGENWSQGFIADTYIFDFGDGTHAYDHYSSHTYTQSGEYIVSLTVLDIYGNIATSSKKIVVGGNTDTVSGSLSGGAANDFINVNGSDTFTFNGGYPDYLVSWNFGDGQIVDGDISTLNQVTHTYTAVGVYWTRLIVTDPNTGHSKLFVKTVTVGSAGSANPQLQLHYTTSGTFPQTVNFSFTNSGSFIPTNYRYTMFDSYGPLATSTTQTYSYTFNQPGQYVVQLIVKDAAGNADMQSQLFEYSNNRLKIIKDGVLTRKTLHRDVNLEKEKLKMIRKFKTN